MEWKESFIICELNISEHLNAMTLCGKVIPVDKITMEQNVNTMNHQNNSEGVSSKTGLQNLNVAENVTEISSCACYTVCCSPETSSVKILIAISACTFAGIVFGWWRGKSRGAFM